ncbi:hypothetical protein ALT721_1820012 [Alteromonas alvinellae]
MYKKSSYKYVYTMLTVMLHYLTNLVKPKINVHQVIHIKWNGK